jgi:hypothetical protein
MPATPKSLETRRHAEGSYSPADTTGKKQNPKASAEATPLQANNPPGGRFVLMANHRPASDETIRPANEREVNMTDAAETLASNE